MVRQRDDWWRQRIGRDPWQDKSATTTTVAGDLTLSGANKSLTLCDSSVGPVHTALIQAPTTITPVTYTLKFPSPPSISNKALDFIYSWANRLVGGCIPCSRWNKRPSTDNECGGSAWVDTLVAVVPKSER